MWECCFLFFSFFNSAFFYYNFFPVISRTATMLSKCMETFHHNVFALFQHCSNFASLLTLISYFFFLFHFYTPFTKHDICAIKNTLKNMVQIGLSSLLSLPKNTQ